MSSHSETTKPLTESEIEELSLEETIATIRSLQARIRDLTVQIVNDEERSSFTAVLLARDERIRALSAALRGARDHLLHNDLSALNATIGHARATEVRRKIVERCDALLTEEADDG